MNEMKRPSFISIFPLPSFMFLFFSEFEAIALENLKESLPERTKYVHMQAFHACLYRFQKTFFCGRPQFPHTSNKSLLLQQLVVEGVLWLLSGGCQRRSTTLFFFMYRPNNLNPTTTTTPSDQKSTQPPPTQPSPPHPPSLCCTKSARI